MPVVFCKLKTEFPLFERNPAKLALRTDRRYTSLVQYAALTALMAVTVVAFVGALTPRLQATFSTLTVALSTGNEPPKAVVAARSSEQAAPLHPGPAQPM